jgi:hypothetical protein
MRKILCVCVGVTLLSLTSCFEIDNWDEPDSSFYGTVYDSYTQQPLLASQNDWKIRIWERSWTGIREGATVNQDLPIKQDGTYKNTKLFSGTYDMLPFDGPFWPVDTLKNVILKGSTEQNFTVTPYLQVVDFDHELGSYNFGSETAPNIRPSLILTCKIKAPLKANNGVTLPNLRYVQAFLSLTTFCGNGSNSSISIPEYTTGGVNDGSKGRIDLNRTWAAEMQRQGMDPDSEISGEYKIGPLPVKSGYTYYIRIGASCNVGSNGFNYSSIVKVMVP